MSEDTVRQENRGPDFEPPEETISVATQYREVAVPPRLRRGLGRRAVVERISPAMETWWDATSVIWKKARTVLDPAAHFIVSVLKTITGLGWTALGLGVVAWVMAAGFGWAEAGVLACLCLLMVVLAAVFTIGRTNVRVSLGVNPVRVFEEQVAVASYEITNCSNRRQSSVRVRLPIGSAAAYFTTPALSEAESCDDWVTIPTEHRGVVEVGPVITYREDPFSLVRREVAWTDRHQLYIHPTIAPLDELGTGLLRDLEGRSTQDMSNSDLAFHTLREYIPGDDQRYIHWKSSARLSSATGEDEFMVRQFLDTRKTHIALVSDLEPSHFASDAEFELSLSCAASIAARTVMDGMDLTVLCGDQVVVRPTANYALDPYSWAQMSERGLMGEFERVRAQAGEASMAMIVTGSGTELDELMRGRAVIPYAIQMIVIRVGWGRPIRLRDTGTFIELSLGSLDDLPKALRGGLV